MQVNLPKPHYRCFACLRQLGFGYDRTAKLFRISKRNVYGWFKHHNLRSIPRPLQKLKPPPVKVDWNKRFASKSQKYLRTYFRTKLWYFWKHNLKPSMADLLGCSRPEFIAHIQSLFKPGMTMQNYITHWEFDHIVSVANFDLRDPVQRAKCFHYSNIQPLHPHDNAVKGHGLKGLPRKKRRRKPIPEISGDTY